MAMHVDTTQAAARGDAAHGYDAPDLRIFVIALFFIFGGITSLNDIIIPKLKELFTLDHATSMLVQSAFFLAYALFSLPAAAIVRRFGYMRTASIGLVTMTAGCLLFIPASANAAFGMFLFALFVLGAGVTYPFGQHVIGDLRYRFTRVANGDSSMNISRAGAAIGVRF